MSFQVIYYIISIKKVVIRFIKRTCTLFHSQCLINLALTGYAVSNVFDGSKDCGGMGMYPSLIYIQLLLICYFFKNLYMINYV